MWIDYNAVYYGVGSDSSGSCCASKQNGQNKGGAIGKPATVAKAARVLTHCLPYTYLSSFSTSFFLFLLNLSEKKRGKPIEEGRWDKKKMRAEEGKKED